MLFKVNLHGTMAANEATTEVKDLIMTSILLPSQEVTNT